MGSPRTGSTWLLHLLCHPLKSHLREPLGFRVPASWSGPPLDAIPVDESHLPNHIVPELPGDRVQADGVSKARLTLNEFMAENTTYFFSPDYAEWWQPELRRLVLVRLHAVIERAIDNGAPVDADPMLILKEVNGSHAAEQVMSLFPRTRMILLVRDGRDVVDSLLHAYLADWATAIPRKSLQPEKAREFWLRGSARRWVANMNAGLRAYGSHPAGLRYMVRYEELLASPAEGLASLSEWLGLDRDRERIEAAVEANRFEALPDARTGPSRPHRAATPGLWRESLSTQEQGTLEEIMGEKLVELGYEV
jgi:hypothetical protein